MILMNDFKTDAVNHGDELKQAFTAVLNSGWYILGESVSRFEQEFADFCQTNYCIGVANGLEAIQIALMALGIGPGDEVITTPLSAFATTLAIINCGAMPVFVDLDRNTLNIDGDKIEEKLTGQTKAILPVHLYGNPADLAKLTTLCQKHQLHLIEDACQAHGARYNDKHVGGFGTFGCFSFYPTKNLGAYGDGGAIVTTDKALAAKAKCLSDYGQVKKYEHDLIGLNSRLDELQAALLLVKLKQLPQDLERRAAIAQRYYQEIANPHIATLPSTPNAHSSFHLFVVKTPFRAVLQKHLTDNQILSHIHYPKGIHQQKALLNYCQKAETPDLPVCDQVTQEILSIPIHPTLDDSQVNKIVDTLNKFQP